MEGDSIYFARRAQQERNAASSSPHPAAQHAHLEMAQRYDDIAAAIDSGQRLLRLVNG